MARLRATSSDEASDEALLAGMAVGDERAGVVFVRRYQRRVYGLALGILRDPGMAEDVAQDAFVRAWTHASVFDPRRGAAATWLLTITRNLSIDALRVRRPEPTDPGDLAFAELASGERLPEDAVLADEMLTQLHDALAGIPEPQRRAVALAAFYGRSAQEIAELESVPLGTAKSRIRMGLTKLRDAVSVEEAS
ncbi:MAG: RNA polymerase sigma factor [Acidimicrobiales bacterium]